MEWSATPQCPNAAVTTHPTPHPQHPTPPPATPHTPTRNTQVVVVAAGYDTRAYRFGGAAAAGGGANGGGGGAVRWFEVDLPSASASKRALVERTLPADQVGGKREGERLFWGQRRQCESWGLGNNPG